MNNNEKKILCLNSTNNKKCPYGSKCVYAHSLSEQKIEPIRHKIYTMIKKKVDLKNIDLINDDKLFKAMRELTKVCNLCEKGACPGGYNCRHGAISQRYRICYENFMYNNCKKIKCPFVHLTEQNLTCYIDQKNKKEIPGILLTENYISKYCGTDSEDDEEVERVIAYLNHMSEDESSDVIC